MESAGQWLENALVDLCKRIESGLDLDRDIISGLVSYCDLAQPRDAKEYLDNIIGQDTGKTVIEEYLKRRGHSDVGGSSNPGVQASKFHAYIKPSTDDVLIGGTKKQVRSSKDISASSNPAQPRKTSTSTQQESKVSTSTSESSEKGVQGSSRKKKTGKVISLAEAAKGSIVFQQGKPCSCQARRHNLVSNCLSCGKIVCEQEGEGPCNFCGSLVLKEGSTYAGLEGSFAPVSDAEVAAEAFAKRLVDYDRNAAARTTVIDDQSDYYEIESNSWLSKEEKELLMKKKEEIEAAERAQRNKVIVTFDLVGRKVLVNEDDLSELESENRILRPEGDSKKEVYRIKPNPTSKIQPVFMDPGPSKKAGKSKQVNKKGLCLEITGRVQHDKKELKHLMVES
ncbi:transcription regulators zinc ion binding [Euphorbia peplus]|nr:transcription regulators zinc ion binding [Euphorbia peplus]